VHDLSCLKDFRKTNRDTADLMLTFLNVGGLGRSLRSIKELHDDLSNLGVVRPSEVIDVHSLRLGESYYLMSPSHFGYSRDMKVKAAEMVTFALNSGDDRELIMGIIKERKPSDIDEVKVILTDVKTVHSSLSSGVL
jgi:hypothetical protein